MASGLPLIQPELLKTYTYLRLRRNHYAHIAQTVSAGFSSFVASEGARLNAFWKASPSIKGTAAIDFTSLAIFQVNVKETISVLRVFLLWVLRMDQAICAQIDPVKISENIAEKLWRDAGGEDFRRNADTVKSLSRRIRTRVRHGVGFSPDLADIESMVWRFR